MGGEGAEDRARARRWIRVQAVSGLVFLVFALVHLVNTMLAALGPSAYDGFQRVARAGYQLAPIEIALVVLPVIVHAIAGIARMLARRGQKAVAVPRRMLAHRITGYVLMAVIVGHVIATRGPSLVRGIYPEHAGIRWSFDALPLWFFPYYLVFALAALFHALHGATIAIPALGRGLPQAVRRGPLPVAVLAIGAVLLVLGVLGLGGVLYDAPVDRTHPYVILGTELVGP